MRYLFSNFKLAFIIFLAALFFFSCEGAEGDFKVGALFGHYRARRYARENAFMEKKLSLVIMPKSKHVRQCLAMIRL